MSAHGTASEGVARLIGVGLPRSGTHYLASAVVPPLQGHHEFDAPRQAIAIAAHRAGALSDAQCHAYLEDRRRRAGNRHADVSWLNASMIHVWLGIEPEARFVMTVRSPLDWMDSYARHNARLRGLARHWQLLRRVLFGAELWPHTPADAVLARQKLPSVDGLLSYWAWHVTSVLAAVPAQRLMIVRTDDLTDSLPKISHFLGWPTGALQSHDAYRDATTQASSRAPGVTELLPREHLASAVQRHLSTVPWSKLGLSDPLDSLRS